MKEEVKEGEHRSWCFLYFLDNHSVCVDIDSGATLKAGHCVKNKQRESSSR
jgi:hypothetical protein